MLGGSSCSGGARKHKGEKGLRVPGAGMCVCAQKGACKDGECAPAGLGGASEQLCGHCGVHSAGEDGAALQLPQWHMEWAQGPQVLCPHHTPEGKAAVGDSRSSFP